MAERFGEEVARRFIEHFGGTEVYLPHKADADHPVSLAVGVDVLGWLIDTFRGGCELHVPTGVRSAWGLASIRLRQLIIEGAYTDREIARLARCDVRSVRRARRSMCERGINVPPRQTSIPNEELS